MRRPSFMPILMSLVSTAMSGATLTAVEQKNMRELIGKLPSSDGKTRRSKVKPDRVKRRNMNHVGRRVRRKHRRAA